MKKTIISFITILLISTGSIFAQSVSFVNYNNDARMAAMGNAGSVLPGAFAVRNNAASIVMAEDVNSELGFSYLSWQPNAVSASSIDFAGFYKLGKFGISAGINHTGFQAYDVTDEFGSIRESIKPSDLLAEIGVAYQIAPSLGLGVSVRYINSKLGDDAKGSTIGADISMVYRADKLHAGLSLSNLGGKIGYGNEEYALPSRVKLGVAYELVDVDKHNLQAVADIGYQFVKEYDGAIVGIGAEYLFNQMIAVRGGYHYADKAIGASHASIGAGVRVSVVGFDFAYLIAGNDSPVNNSFMLTGRISF